MVISIFSAYVEPLFKYINHLALLQEWKLNLDDEQYKKHIDANLYKPYEKNCHDSDLYWPISIKDTIQWFYYLNIMEHTENIMKKKVGMIP